MKQGTDILLDELDDLSILGGDLVIGDGFTQEVGLILRINQGEVKSDPLIGANLIRLIKTNVSADEMQRQVKMHLTRDGKNYNDVKELINLKRG